MFSNRRFRLRGEHFEECVRRMSNTAYQNYSTLKMQADIMTPRRWEDRLTKEQDSRFHFITQDEQWYSVSAIINDNLFRAPALSLALVWRDNDRGKDLQFVLVGTMEGYVACFALEGLATFKGAVQKAELLPDQVREYLRDPAITKITSGLFPYFTDAPEGFEVKGQVEMDHIYAQYQNNGVIDPAIRGEGDIKWQLAFAVEYHHRATSRKAFETLIGRNGYSKWPNYRQKINLDSLFLCNLPLERWYLYYEGVAPHLFLNRLLRHGIVFGGVPQIRAEIPLYRLFQVFLAGGGTCDPLPLYLGPPPTHTALGREHISVVNAKKRTASLPDNFGTAVDSSHSPRRTPRPLFTLHEGGEQPQTQDEPYSPSRPYYEGKKVKKSEAAEDVVMLDDPELEKEFPNPSEGSEEAATTAVESAAPTTTATTTAATAPSTSTGGATPGPSNNSGESRSGTEPERAAGAASGAPVDPVPDPRPGPSARAEATAGERAGQPGPSGANSASTTSVSTDSLPDLRQRLTEIRTSGDTVHRVGREGEGGAEVEPRQDGGAGAVEVKRELHSRGSSAAREEATNEVEPQRTVQDHRVRLQLRALAHSAAEDPGVRGRLAAFPSDANVRLARRVNLQARLGPPAEVRPAVVVGPRLRDRRDPMLDHYYMTTRERYDAAYETTPLFDRRCEYCGGQRCSKFAKGTNIPYCDLYRDQRTRTPTRRVCDYRRCDNDTEHQVQVCPMLHARCPICLCRGHLSGCDLSNEGVMTGFRDDFEEFALVGVWTRKQTRDLAWSWFPYPKGAPRQPGHPPVPYAVLKEMDTFEAMDYLTGILSLPQNRGYVPPCYEN